MKIDLLPYLIGVISIISLQSCGKPANSHLLKTQEITTARTWLLSELSELEDHLVECPFQIENLSDSPQSIRYISTGCSCYGVTHDGEKIDRGSSIQVPAKSTIELGIKAQAPMSESLQKYRATFEFPPQNNPQIRKLYCEMQVYQDLKIFPKVFICDTEPTKTTSVVKEVTIERIYRSETKESPSPEFKNLPEGVELKKMLQLDAPVELEKGIWKAIWSAQLQIPVYGDLSPSGKTTTYAVSFPETESTRKVAHTAKLIQRVRVPVHFPKEIHFGKMANGDSRKRSLFLSSVAGGKFQLKSKTDSLPTNLQVLIPSELAPRYKIDLILTGSDPGEWNHKLILKTDLEDQPEIEINLNAIFTSPNSD